MVKTACCTRPAWRRHRTLLIMKLTFLLLTVAFLNVNAEGFAQTVSFSGKNVPLKKIFSAIEKQTGYVVTYSSEVVADAKPVSIEVKNVPLSEFLDKILSGQHIGYTIEGKGSIFLYRKPPATLPDRINEINADTIKPIKISGTVKGINNQPLSGASIRVKGDKVSAIADDKGYFELMAAPGSTLIISYVGYSEREFRIANSSPVQIELTNINIEEEVVTVSTGYQRISKERFVGSYVQLDSAAFHGRPGAGIIERLDGTVTGVLFNKKANLFPIQIRGISTLGINGTSTEPLIVLDNFPLPPNTNLISKVNANDIESIVVLKDAAAASVWGTRAGNGVIIVTTKKGKYNQRTSVEVSSNFRVDENPDLYFVQRISPSEFIDIEQMLLEKNFYNSALNNTRNRPVVSPVVEILDRKRRGLLTEQEATAQIAVLKQNDLRDELNRHIYRKPTASQHYFNISGGAASFAYQLSGGFNTSRNAFQHIDHDRAYTLNSNFTFRPLKAIELVTGINYSQDIVRSFNYNLPEMSPYLQLMDAGGNALAIPYMYRKGYIDTAGAGQLLDWGYRPVDELKNLDYRGENKVLRLNFGANFNLASWLKAGIYYQYTSTTTSTRDHQNLQMWRTRDLINRFQNPHETNPNLRNPVPVGGILGLQEYAENLYNLRGVLNFNKNWRDHELSAMISSEFSNSKGSGKSLTLYGYNDEYSTYQPMIDHTNFWPRFYAASPGQTELIPGLPGYGESAITRIVSVLGNLSYTYKNRYYLFATARRDGSNIFGVSTNNRWKPLWSAGAGWEISKEAFYKIDWLSYLKVRASYGYTGNVNNTISGKLLLYLEPFPASFTNYTYNSISAAPSPNLRWEEVRTINTGIDFRMLNNRLSGSLELYQRRSRDVIVAERLAPSVGISQYYLNSASLRIRGFDLQLNSVNLRSGDFSWNSGLGLSYAKTTVMEYKLVTRWRAQDYITYDLNASPGSILYGISSYRWAGLDPTNGEPQGYLNKAISKNYNAIGSDSLGNQVFHGSSIPLVSAFLNNSFSWKGFSASVNIVGKFNYYFREPALNLQYAANYNTNNYLATYRDRWQQQGDEAFTTVPSMTYPATSNAGPKNTFYRYASIHVKRADNIRLNFVNLNYTWTNKGQKKVPLQSLQVFVYISNLNIMLWRATDSIYDPEYNGGSSTTISSPPAKSYTAGITLGF